MKIFFLINNKMIKNINDINVNDTYGIYQDKSEAFLKCKNINKKLNKNRFNSDIYFYIIEINLEINKILNLYFFENNEIIIDNNKKKKLIL